MGKILLTQECLIKYFCTIAAIDSEFLVIPDSCYQTVDITSVQVEKIAFKPPVSIRDKAIGDMVAESVTFNSRDTCG